MLPGRMTMPLGPTRRLKPVSVTGSVRRRGWARQGSSDRSLGRNDGHFFNGPLPLKSQTRQCTGVPEQRRDFLVTFLNREIERSFALKVFRIRIVDAVLQQPRDKLGVADETRGLQRLVAVATALLQMRADRLGDRELAAVAGMVEQR